MEASKFRFGATMPPAFKFDPTDADIVAYYLLPRALNLPNPYARAVIEGDPAGAPPWELLQEQGGVDHAFFFGPPTDPSQNGGRKNRNVEGGGVWQGQKSFEDTVTILRPGGRELDIRYKRYDLSFCLAKRGRTTGYVMHEYEILSPSLPGTVLTRIKAPKKAANRQPVAPAAAAAEQQVSVPDPEPEQPIPSYKYDAALAMSNGEGFGGAPADQQVPDPEQLGPMIDNGEGFVGAHDRALALYTGGMVENAGYYCAPLQYDLNLAEYEISCCLSIEDQSGASYNDDAAAMNGEAFTGAQSDALYCDPSGYVPECGGFYSNDHGEYQQWQHQQDTTSQYQAGDDAVTCAGGEQQAAALCGNSDNVGVVATETSANSTVSLCGGDGEVECDDVTFYNLLFGDGGDFKCEQRNAVDPCSI